MLQDIPVNNQNKIRCRHCFGQTAEDSENCELCGTEIENGNQPKTLFGKIKQMLGVDLSSDIVTINLKDDGHFFTNQEIESLLDIKNVTVLGLEDVPDREAMFCQSRRVRKPVKRGKK